MSSLKSTQILKLIILLFRGHKLIEFQAKNKAEDEIMKSNT
jgi:hypothetical protein